MPLLPPISVRVLLTFLAPPLFLPFLPDGVSRLQLQDVLIRLSLLLQLSSSLPMQQPPLTFSILLQLPVSLGPIGVLSLPLLRLQVSGPIPPLLSTRQRGQSQSDLASEAGATN